MSIYIKGMEMPKACVYRENGHLITCPLYDIDGYCGALNTEASHKENGKLSDCPLVPVPPHGRLGDLDALAQQIEHERFNHTHTDGLAARHHVAEYGHFLKAISDAPTIIPADPAEGGDVK